MASRGLSSMVIFTPNLLTIGLMLLINTELSLQQNILSVKRSHSGDSFKVQPDKELVICDSATATKLCDKYNALSGHSGLGSCRCECGLLDTTFYSKKAKCVSSQTVVVDNQCTINVKEGKASSRLSILDTSLSTPKEIHLVDNGELPKQCPRVTAKWFYYQHNTWIVGSPNIFTVVAKQTPNKDPIDLFTQLTNGSKTWVLQMSNGLADTYQGVLIKVDLQCEYNHGFNPAAKCVMFKVLGTHKVIPPPPTTVPPSTTQPSTLTPTTVPPSTKLSTTQPSVVTPTTTLSSTVTPQTDKISSQATIPSTTTATDSPTTAKNPHTETYNSGNDRIWIVFVAGGVSFLVVLALTGVAMFLLVRRHRNIKHKKETIVLACTRPSDSITRPTSPPHDYEYVVYPELKEGFQPSNSLDNTSFGRGPGNELIIRTPAGASSDSLKSRSTNNSIKSTNSLTPCARHMEYLQGNSTYQSLIRTHTPEVDDQDDDHSEQGQRQYLDLIHVEDNKDIPEYMVLEPPVNSDDEKP